MTTKSTQSQATLEASHTFLWHDYETFGANTKKDRPSQFAAIRTDANLKEIGEAVVLYCKPAPDFLPDPQSCLLTGITPQECLQKGVSEHEFASQIEKLFAQPETIGVGYNSIRFDDEITRFMFWRNLIDPYAREWQNKCGRWDLLDVMRMAHALRPEGILWPQDENGFTSFKLEKLSAINRLNQYKAHDALSDVRAMLALARLLKQKQPRLFDFCFSLHKKDRVAKELDLPVLPHQAKPFLHVSGMFSVERGCLALMQPLFDHPINRNEVIAWNLNFDPSELADLKPEMVRKRLFTRKSELLAEGLQPLPIKTIHVNKSPMVVSQLKTLTPEMAARWNLNIEQSLIHAEKAQNLPDLSALWMEVFKPKDEKDNLGEPILIDVDEDLYGSGFLKDEDRRRLNRIRQQSPEELAVNQTGFDDPRLTELFFRYRARNFPEYLNDDEKSKWQNHCADRLLNGKDNYRTSEQLFKEIDIQSEYLNEKLSDENLNEKEIEKIEKQLEILGDLYDYACQITPERQ